MASRTFRIALHESAELRAPAEEVWSLLTDWGGMLRWRLPPDLGGLRGPRLITCELLGRPDAVPRTRRMRFDDGRTVDEQIIYQNDQHRRFHYTKSEPPGSELSGYVASAYVDAIDSCTCALHIASWFDAATEEASASAAARFATVYRAIFAGFRRYFSQAAPIARNDSVIKGR